MKEAYLALPLNFSECVCKLCVFFPIVSITGVSSSPATTMASPVELTSYSTSTEDSRITSEQVHVELAQNPQGVADQ